MHILVDTEQNDRKEEYIKNKISYSSYKPSILRFHYLGRYLEFTAQNLVTVLITLFFLFIRQNIDLIAFFLKVYKVFTSRLYWIKCY